MQTNIDEAFVEHLKSWKSRNYTVYNKKEKIKVPAETSYAHIDDELSDIDASLSLEIILNNSNRESSSVCDDDCPVTSDGKYVVNNFVIVNYLKNMYLGIITSIDSNGAIVKSMDKSKSFYKWSMKENTIFY